MISLFQEIQSTTERYLYWTIQSLHNLGFLSSWNVALNIYFPTTTSKSLEQFSTLYWKYYNQLNYRYSGFRFEFSIKFSPTLFQIGHTEALSMPAILLLVVGSFKVSGPSL